MNAKPICRVLIVDDDAQTSHLIAAAISCRCDSVTLADSMTQGLQWASMGGFSLVLLDLMLPDSRGMETVERIPEFLFTGASVVVVTGFDVTESLCREVRARGALDLLFKTDHGFVDRLRNLIPAHEALAQK